jgi:hypothetical protein
VTPPPDGARQALLGGANASLTSHAAEVYTLYPDS